jgi:hypothetical protein
VTRTAVHTGRALTVDVATEPYVWMGSWRRGGPSAWLEFPADATSHAALVEVAERLHRDFGAVVTERFADRAADEDKEYWRLRVGSASLLLMRKPPVCPVGLCVETGDIALLVRIARAWGVEQFVGWRWPLWRAWRRLVARHDG